jgi:hypothetical protein
VKFSGDWDETDPFALELAREMFSSAFPALRGPGARSGPAQPSPQKNFALEELPSRTSTASSPKKNSPQENGSPRPSSPRGDIGTTYKLSPSYLVQGRLNITALNRDEDLARNVLPLFGQTDLDTPATCCLPGHSRSGWVTRAKDQRFVYICDCQGDTGYRSLTETYASIVSGRAAPPSPGKTGKREKLHRETAHFLWTRRLLSEVGAVLPDQVALLPLPTNADNNTAVVYDGLRLFLGLRAGTDLPEKFPFTRRFVADWCGLSMDAAREGLEGIRKAHIIEKVSETEIGGRKVNIYMVGAGA